MYFHGIVAFDESGFYYWKHHGWEFLIEFSYRPKSFANPNLLIIPPVNLSELLEIRDILSTDDLADRFLRMQSEEAAHGRLMPGLPPALTNGLLDQLLLLHRGQWEESEHQRIALGA